MSGIAKIDAGHRSLLWLATHRLIDFLRLKSGGKAVMSEPTTRPLQRIVATAWPASACACARPSRSANQYFRGERWHIAQDGFSNQFFPVPARSLRHCRAPRRHAERWRKSGRAVSSAIPTARPARARSSPCSPSSTRQPDRLRPAGRHAPALRAPSQTRSPDDQSQVFGVFSCAFRSSIRTRCSTAPGPSCAGCSPCRGVGVARRRRAGARRRVRAMGPGPRPNAGHHRAGQSLSALCPRSPSPSSCTSSAMRRA